MCFDLTRFVLRFVGSVLRFDGSNLQFAVHFARSVFHSVGSVWVLRCGGPHLQVVMPYARAVLHSAECVLRRVERSNFQVAMYFARSVWRFVVRCDGSNL